jgi:hypothetical protein
MERPGLARSFTVYCVASRNGKEWYGPPLFSTDKLIIMYFFLLVKNRYLCEHSINDLAQNTEAVVELLDDMHRGKKNMLISYNNAQVI